MIECIRKRTGRKRKQRTGNMYVKLAPVLSYCCSVRQDLLFISKLYVETI